MNIYDYLGLSMSSLIQDEEKELQFVVFGLSEKEYAVNILQVIEIRKLTPVTRVPKSRDYYLGVINLRGNVIPIVDLKKRLGLPVTDYNDNSRVIVIKLNDVVFGIVVDCVDKIVNIDEKTLKNNLSNDSLIEKRFIKQVVNLDDRIFIVLNLEEIIKL